MLYFKRIQELATTFDEKIKALDLYRLEKQTDEIKESRRLLFEELLAMSQTVERLVTLFKTCNEEERPKVFEKLSSIT